MSTLRQHTTLARCEAATAGQVTYQITGSLHHEKLQYRGPLDPMAILGVKIPTSLRAAQQVDWQARAPDEAQHSESSHSYRVNVYYFS